MAESIWSDGLEKAKPKPNPGSGAYCLPPVGPEPRSKNAPGGARSSHRPQMSSGRLFLDRVARQHCPSPLHRHAQTTTHLLPTLAKQDISTLQRIGHFYFALTHGRRAMQLDERVGIVWRLGCRRPEATNLGKEWTIDSLVGALQLGAGEFSVP